MASFAHDVLLEANRILVTERAVLRMLNFDGNFVRAVRLLVTCRGRVLTSGVGKSALVAQRLAGLLNVCGCAAWFLDPVQAVHGDLGGVHGRADMLVVVSRSGETRELLGLVEYCERWNMPIILITTCAKSSLAVRAEVVLVHPGQEACRHGLTPTSSLTAAGVLCDALALCAQAQHCFTPRQFAALHPGGHLGRRLVKVADVMVTGKEVAWVTPMDRLTHTAVLLGHCRGIVLVEDPAGGLAGVATAGDLARYLDDHNQLDGTVADILTQKPHTIMEEALVVDAISKMEREGVMALPATRSGMVTGVIHLHDALRVAD